MNELVATLVVHYQVTHRDIDPPLVRYRCDHKSGFNVTKAQMLESLKKSPLTIKYFNMIELVEVDDLDLVPSRMRLSPVQINREISENSAHGLEPLFSLHRQMGVPIRYTVLLVFKWLQLDIASVCEEVGFHRNYLNAALSGKRQPSEVIRAKMVEKIGLDPWGYAEWVLPTILDREIFSICEHGDHAPRSSLAPLI